jgi:hypothetical protein
VISVAGGADVSPNRLPIISPYREIATMSNEQLIPTLALFTIIAVLGLAIWQFAVFLRKRKNRQIAAHALDLDTDSNSSAPRR